jgi:NADPH-dependent 2,4-dienoyl-CoA reductase/sulfur reductase-like enzyme
MSGRFEVVVVGAGPAGIAAAVCAAEAGRRVALVDDNPAAGGQIWRSGGRLPRTARKWMARLSASGAEWFAGTRVFDAAVPGVLCAEQEARRLELRYEKLILATGARELFLPFPGWTLPGVFGAGGLDALARGGFPIEGKRVIVSGTGPLLLAVAAHLAERGAKIVAICEQASLGRLARFAGRMLGEPEKLAQGAAYRWAARGAQFHAGCWVVAAHGGDHVERVTLRKGARTWDVPCDAVACGFHLVPNTEMARLLGCRMEDGFVTVDERMQTSVANVYCAGEPTGIGGVELALVEGQIAGLAATGRREEAQKLAPRRRGMLRFVETLKDACALDPALRGLASDTTMVCRCEDVTFGAMHAHTNWRDAKLHTRCGMGPCQGRVCGAAAEFVFGWEVDGARPPVFPALVSSLVGSDKENG